MHLIAALVFAITSVFIQFMQVIILQVIPPIVQAIVQLLILAVVHWRVSLPLLGVGAVTSLVMGWI